MQTARHQQAILAVKKQLGVCGDGHPWKPLLRVDKIGGGGNGFSQLSVLAGSGPHGHRLAHRFELGLQILQHARGGNTGVSGFIRPNKLAGVAAKAFGGRQHRHIPVGHSRKIPDRHALGVQQAAGVGLAAIKGV